MFNLQKFKKILLFHSGSIHSRRMVINAARCLAFPVAADSRFFPRAKQQAKAKPDTQTFQDCSTQTEITSVDQNAGCRCTSSLRFREHGLPRGPCVFRKCTCLLLFVSPSAAAWLFVVGGRVDTCTNEFTPWVVAPRAVFNDWPGSLCNPLREIGGLLHSWKRGYKSYNTKAMQPTVHYLYIN